MEIKVLAFESNCFLRVLFILLNYSLAYNIYYYMFLITKCNPSGKIYYEKNIN